MNKKGYTLIEVLMTIALVGMLMYSALYIPTDIMAKYNSYTIETKKMNDLIILRTAIISDLNNSYVEIIDTYKIKIGESIYTFGDKVLREDKGNILNITDNQYSYKIENNSLIIYNDKISLNYNLSNSFKKEGK